MHKFLKILLKIVKLFFFLIPLLMLSFSIASGGLLKFLGSLGLKDWQSNDYFYLLFLGIPGFIAGVTSLLAGIGFTIIIGQKIMVEYFNLSIVPARFAQQVKKIAWISMAILLLLWFIGDSQRSDPIVDRQTVSFAASGIRNIIIDFPEDKIAYFRKKIIIKGSPDTSEIAVETTRRIGAWNKHNQEEKLKNYPFTCEMSDNGKLVIGGHVDQADWTFFPYPEIEFNIIAPEKQLIDITCRQSDSDRKNNVEISNLLGPIRLDLGQSRVKIENVNVPELELKIKDGGVRLLDVKSEKLDVVVDSASVQIDKLIGKNTSIAIESGSLRINNLVSDNIIVSSKISDLQLKGLRGAKANLSTQRGRILVDDFSINSLKCENKSGRISLEPRAVPDSSQIEAISESGIVWVYLPEDAVPTVKMETNNGIKENQFAGDQKTNTSPVIFVKTVSGSIRIKKQHYLNRAPNSNLPAEALPGE